LKLLALVVLLAGLGRAEISVGVRGGLPFGDAFETLRTQDLTVAGKNQFVVGPTVELRLPAGFGVSLDALYRRYSFETGQQDQSGAQWEFPLMLRYRFPGIVARPFVAIGPIFTTITGVTAIKNSQGLAIGAGVDAKIPFVRLTPELRYSRRFQDVIVETRFGNLVANSNQIDLLLGVTF
jgi:hypothetical protein